MFSTLALFHEQVIYYQDGLHQCSLWLFQLHTPDISGLLQPWSPKMKLAQLIAARNN